MPDYMQHNPIIPTTAKALGESQSGFKRIMGYLLPYAFTAEAKSGGMPICSYMMLKLG